MIASSAPGFAPENLRVLLFEDSAMDAALIKKFLQTAGVRQANIFHTDTIPSALQVLTREKVDVCITDYFLRPHTGFDLMDEAKRCDLDVPFIMLTGLDDRAVDDGALSRGAYDFLVKGDLTVEGLERSMRYALDRHRKVAALTQAAVYDQMTGLLNRTAFTDRLAQCIDDARPRGAGVGVLLINLNGTKFLNESFGHKIGDDLLKAVAAKLTSLKRSTDVIGRLGGDEFAVIMTNFLLPGHALTQARKILDGISVPMATRDGEHPVTAAAGLVAETISRKSSTTPDLVDRMMQLAGRAMFEAKQRTRMRGMSELVMGRLGQDSVH